MFLFISVFLVTVIFLNAFPSFELGGFRPAGVEDRYPTFMVIVCCILNFIFVDLSIRGFDRLSRFFLRRRMRLLYAQLSHSIGCFLLFACIPLFAIINFDVLRQPNILLKTVIFGLTMLIVAAGFCFPIMRRIYKERDKTRSVLTRSFISMSLIPVSILTIVFIAQVVDFRFILWPFAKLEGDFRISVREVHCKLSDDKKTHICLCSRHD